MTKQMLLTSKTNNCVYDIRVSPSIFTNRNGKFDCSIAKENKDHGWMTPEGVRVSCIARIAYESGDFLRNYESLPGEISMDFLQKNGFVDASAMLDARK